MLGRLLSGWSEAIAPVDEEVAPVVSVFRRKVPFRILSGEELDTLRCPVFFSMTNCCNMRVQVPENHILVKLSGHETYALVLARSAEIMALLNPQYSPHCVIRNHPKHLHHYKMLGAKPGQKVSFHDVALDQESGGFTCFLQCLFAPIMCCFPCCVTYNDPSNRVGSRLVAHCWGFKQVSYIFREELVKAIESYSPYQSQSNLSIDHYSQPERKYRADDSQDDNSDSESVEDIIVTRLNTESTIPGSSSVDVGDNNQHPEKKTTRLNTESTIPGSSSVDVGDNNQHPEKKTTTKKKKNKKKTKPKRGKKVKMHKLGSPVAVEMTTLAADSEPAQKQQQQMKPKKTKSSLASRNKKKGKTKKHVRIQEARENSSSSSSSESEWSNPDKTGKTSSPPDDIDNEDDDDDEGVEDGEWHEDYMSTTQ